MTVCDKCDHSWQVWPLVTSVTTCHMCDHLWQVWPPVTRVTACDKGDSMWQLWPHVTSVTTVTCGMSKKVWQMWQVPPLVTCATTCDKCDHLWQVRPLMTSVTTCDNFDHMWLMWQTMTDVTGVTICDKCYRMWQVWPIVNIFRGILQFKLCFSWLVTHHKIHALLIIIDIIWKLLSFPYKKCTFFLFWYITSNYESYIGLNNTGWPRSAGTWVVLGQTQPNPGPRTSELPCRCKFSSMIDL